MASTRPSPGPHRCLHATLVAPRAPSAESELLDAAPEQRERPRPAERCADRSVGEHEPGDGAHGVLLDPRQRDAPPAGREAEQPPGGHARRRDRRDRPESATGGARDHLDRGARRPRHRRRAVRRERRRGLGERPAPDPQVDRRREAGRGRLDRHDVRALDEARGHDERPPAVGRGDRVELGEERAAVEADGRAEARGAGRAERGEQRAVREVAGAGGRRRRLGPDDDGGAVRRHRRDRDAQQVGVRRVRSSVCGAESRPSIVPALACTSAPPSCWRATPRPRGRCRRRRPTRARTAARPGTRRTAPNEPPAGARPSRARRTPARAPARAPLGVPSSASVDGGERRAPDRLACASPAPAAPRGSERRRRGRARPGGRTAADPRARSASCRPCRAAPGNPPQAA